MLKQIKTATENFRVKIAQFICPEYPECVDRLTKEAMDWKETTERLQIIQDGHARQLFELGKYKANYRLIKEAIEQRREITLKVGADIHKNWFPGTCKIEPFYNTLSGGQELPHKNLK